MEIKFDAASRGASVEWVSQTNHDAVLLFLPCTYLTYENQSMIPGKDMRLIQVRAAVSTARPDVKDIRTIDDRNI